MRKSQNFKVFSYVFTADKDGGRTEESGIVFIRRVHSKLLKVVYEDTGTLFTYNISMPKFDVFGNLELTSERKLGNTETDAFYHFLVSKYENPFLVDFKQVKI